MCDCSRRYTDCRLFELCYVLCFSIFFLAIYLFGNSVSRRSSYDSHLRMYDRTGMMKPHLKKLISYHSLVSTFLFLWIINMNTLSADRCATKTIAYPYIGIFLFFHYFRYNSKNVLRSRRDINEKVENVTCSIICDKRHGAMR